MNFLIKNKNAKNTGRKTLFRRSAPALVFAGFVVMLIIISIAPLPLNADMGDPSNIDSIKLPKCGNFLTSDISLSGCLANITYWVLFVPTVWAVSIVGWLFDIILSLSMSKEFLNSDFPKIGWGVVRDVANVAFIFILLYIAIATILRVGRSNTRQVVGGFNTRQVLVNLVVVALLVNFSLFFTRVVIDAGNILSLGFYNQINARVELSVPFFEEDVEVKSISSALVSGYDPQKLISTELFESREGDDEAKRNYGIIMAFVAGLAVNLVTVYVFLVAGIIFLARIPILWLVMIAAPAAFVAWILPKTKIWTKKWFSTLINWSLISAIFLFFLWLIFYGLIDSEAINITIRSSEGVSSYISILLGILLQTSIIIALLVLSIRVTKRLASEAGSGAVRAADWVGGKYTGMLKAGGKKMVKPFKREIKGGDGRLAEGLQTAATKNSATGFAAKLALTTVPGAKAITGKMGAVASGDIETTKKEIEGLSNAALKNRMGFAATMPERAAITETLAKRGDLTPGGGLTEGRLLGTIREMKKSGRTEESKDVEKLSWQYRDLSKVAKKDEKSGSNNLRDIIRNISPDDISKMETKKIRSWLGDEKVKNELFREFSGSHAEKAALHPDPEFGKEFYETLKKSLGRQSTRDYLTKIGNPRLGVYLNQAPAGKNISSIYDLPIEPE